MENKKTLGIIGGLGPAASSYFYERLTKLTKVNCDQQHIELILFSCPSIPDRSAFIIGESADSPLPEILKVVEKLNNLGVDYIALPCVTAHYFIDEIRRTSVAPVISIIEETVKCLRHESVGILATDGTIACEIFQNALTAAGIHPVVPDLQKDVMRAIWAVKAGKMSELSDGRVLSGILDNCKAKGASAVLLACTELSLLEFEPRLEIVDCIEILARRAIVLCGGKIV